MLSNCKTRGTIRFFDIVSQIVPAVQSKVYGWQTGKLEDSLNFGNICLDSSIGSPFKCGCQILEYERRIGKDKRLHGPLPHSSQAYHSTYSRSDRVGFWIASSLAAELAASV